MRALPDARLIDRSRDIHVISIRLIAVSGAVFVALLLAGGGVWTRVNPGTLTVWGIATVALLTMADIIRTYEVGMLNIAHRQRTFAAWNVVDAWARPLMAVLLVIAIAPVSPAVIVAYAFATLIVYAGFRRFRSIAVAAPDTPQTDQDKDTDWVRLTNASLKRYALPLVPVALFGWLIGVADRFILASLAGVAETGLYIAAYALASAPLLAVATIFTNVFARASTTLTRATTTYGNVI